MYSIRNVFTQEPASIASVFTAVFNVLVLMHVLPLTLEQLGGVNAIALPLLSLFYVRPRVVSKDALAKLNGNGNATVPAVPSVPPEA